MTKKDFLSGDLIMMKDVSARSLIIWDSVFSNALDELTKTELATIIKDQDSYGWIQVLTPRGIIGYVHKTNVAHSIERK